MKISFTDINRRLNRLNSSKSPTLINMKVAQIYTDKHVFCQNNAINSILNWESLGESSNDSFEKALDIFDELCLNANESTIRTSCDVLVENVDKVRDQIQLANSLKYRMGVMKQKPTIKINKRYKDVTEKIRSALDGVEANFKKITPPSVPTANNPGVAKECYEKIYNKCLAIKECDRIIENYNNISKRFNIDRVVTGIQYSSDLYQACAEIASCVDTYKLPFKNKYNSALETAAYVFDKHYMNYPKNKIVEAVTDYFIFSGSLKETQISDVRSIMNISVLFEQSDFSSLSWVDKKEEFIKEEKTISVEDYGVDFETLTEADLAKEVKKRLKVFNKDVKKSTKKLIKDAKKGNPEEHRDAEIHQMVDDFRSQCVKNEDSKANLPALRALVNKIFTKSPYQIVYELPNLFSIIRVSFIIGVTAINPILGIITLITNEAIKINLSRKQMEKIIKAYKNEIDSVKTKIEKAKDNESKDKFEKYLAELNKDLEKLEQYERNIYSEEENDERDAEKYASEYDDDDFGDDDWGDGEWDDFDASDFEEVASIICIADYMTSISENLIDDNVDGIVYNNIFKLDNDSIDALTDFSITVPVILEKDKLKESLINYRNSLRESASNTKDYMRIDCLNENIYKLDKSGYSYNTAKSCRDSMLYLACLNEITKIKSNNYVLEMDFGNSIKLAINNLKRDAIKLSDKEKQVSSSIDVAASNVAKGIESSMMSGNREAVIKGRVIPSASKCIKLALTFIGAWVLNPAIAVIGAIGGFACSKKMQAKERQLVLDDIEIELKMCERYLRAAEDEGDMKKIRQIETIQRNLERQRQRIKYRMITVYHQDVPNTNKNDD